MTAAEADHRAEWYPVTPYGDIVPPRVCKVCGKSELEDLHDRPTDRCPNCGSDDPGKVGRECIRPYLDGESSWHDNAEGTGYIIKTYGGDVVAVVHDRPTGADDNLKDSPGVSQVDLAGRLGAIYVGMLEWLGEGDAQPQDWADADAIGQASARLGELEADNRCLATTMTGDNATDLRILYAFEAGIAEGEAENERLRRECDWVSDPDAPDYIVIADRLRAAVADAVRELDAVHRPWDGRLCVVCGSADGSWPCTSRMVADDLRKLL